MASETNLEALINAQTSTPLPKPVTNLSQKIPSDSRKTAIMEEQSDDFAFLDLLIRRMDRHLIFPLLEHQENREDISDERRKDLILAKYNLLKDTNMVDFVSNLYQTLHDTDDVPAEFAKRNDKVRQQMNQYEESTAKLVDLLDDEGVTSNLRSDKLSNMKYLESDHGVTAQQVEDLYAFGRLQFSCANYGEAAELLYRFRILSTDNDKVAKATWGKLVCEILSTNWEVAMEEITKVKESIETRLFSNPRAQLTARESLVHWALFPFFNYEPAQDPLIEMYLSAPYISSIQTSCPWILRYLAAAIITNRTRGKNASTNSHTYQKQLKDLIRIVRQEMYEYEDPITEFMKALYIDSDFDEAQKKLTEAEEVLKNDFFLQNSTEAFIESARHLISESYCKIHQRIDIK